MTRSERTHPMFAHRLLPLALLLVLVLPALAACGSDSTIRETPHCDGVLNTVESSVDDAFDEDGDGYFDASDPECQETYGIDQLDCDDEDAEIGPGMQESTCNDLDDDCDEATPDAPDEDGDGVTLCDGDCDDLSADVAPGLAEVACDGLDNDCDDATPDGDDLDADGHDDCTDCDDDDADVNPGSVEVECNGLDDDCNELTPDGDDIDADGFVHCFDCDDNSPLVYPGATEVCEDGTDQDCDGLDASCGPDSWDGVWDTTTVTYGCALGSIEIDFHSVSVVDTDPSISFTFIGGVQPGTVSGTLGAGDSFSATYGIAGGCDEDYAFTGSFTSADTFAATLTATFTDTTGTGFGCFDCTNQSFLVDGTR
jgi:hypothetical protein